MTKAMKLFVPITKVDLDKREVYGVAVAEEPDKASEIFDYATSKPHFEKWSSEFSKRTNGASLGNVRAMHGAQAAGKLTALTFNDANKAIEVCAKVVDDQDWEKCKEGVYTGFSIGGSYAKRWADGKLTRYTAAPSEVSLVDNPCVPGATFSMIKADGTSESRAFKPANDAGKLDKLRDAVSRLAATIKKAEGDAADQSRDTFQIGEMASILRDVQYLLDMMTGYGMEGDVEPWADLMQQAHEAIRGAIAMCCTEPESAKSAPGDRLGAVTDNPTGDDMKQAEIQKLIDDQQFVKTADLAKVIDDAVQKAVQTALTDNIAKAVTDATKPMSEKIDGIDKSTKEFGDRLTKVEKTPVPGGPGNAAVIAVSKGADGGQPDIAAQKAALEKRLNDETDPVLRERIGRDLVALDIKAGR